MKVVLAGFGAVGVRVARQLLSSSGLDELVVMVRQPERAEARVVSLGGAGAVCMEALGPGSMARVAAGADVVVLSGGRGSAELAQEALSRGAHVICCSDDPREVRALLAQGPQAEKEGRSLVVGVAMAPGLSCLLSWWAASKMDQLLELHVATLGTGGPACARRRHAALREPVEEWRESAWERKVAGSGRELVWFPGQTGADCYRVNRPDPLLLTMAFPGLRSATARAAASRRDRFTSRLPMLRPPHPEGTVGAVRVEARGTRAGAAESVIVGAVGRPALLAATVAATAALAAAQGQVRPGAGGLASLAISPRHLLAVVQERGARVMTFQGAEISPAW